MDQTSNLVTLFRDYLVDLEKLLDLASSKLTDRGNAELLIEKVILEAERIVVYEQFFLLPVVADRLGTATAETEAARLARLDQLAVGLSTSTEGERAQAFEGLRRAAVELSDHQRSSLLPRVADVFDEAILLELGTHVTPTQETGATHSHPTGIVVGSGRLDPGLPLAARAALTEEVRNREPTIVPVRV